jgi:Anti-sigma-K factor rskA
MEPWQFLTSTRWHALRQPPIVVVVTRPLTRFGATCLAGLALSCGGSESAGPPIPEGATLTLTSTGLPALDPVREGSYEAWVIDAEGDAHSAGRFVPAGGGVSLVSPIAGARAFEITVEPPGDSDDRPSEQRLLRGEFSGHRAALSLADAVTHGAPLKDVPGTFTMFTPSDNFENPYPSHEEAGVWLFNMRPRETPQNDMWVRLTQLRPGWTYEGWMVRDIGTADEIWLSYGKFLPDETGALSEKDDTGWGPFSGVVDFRTNSVEDFPGDDWVSNPLGYPFPSALSLPLNLREKDAAGRLRWTHVISIEPATNKGEPIGAERPFFIRPYSDPFGDGEPGVPRVITYRPSAVPRGAVQVQ